MQRMVCCVVALLAVAAAARAGEVEVESRVTSVGMFKNGLALVTRAVVVPKDGVYVVNDVPQPVHGTFWIESTAKVETRVTSREFEAAAEGADLRRELAGKFVTIHLRDLPPVTGTVLAEPAQGQQWDRTYNAPASRWHGASASNSRPSGPKYLVLSTANNGRVYVDPSLIAYVEAGQAGKAVERRPVLIFNVAAAGNKPATINISYLTKGISWAPSYRVDISARDKLTIEQKAVIKNELEDLRDAELWLITGFPSVEYGHVVSPMSLGTSWASFFQQLRSRPSDGNYGNGNIMTQQAVIYNTAPTETGIDFSAAPQGEGPDVHYNPIGARTLAEGDSLVLSVAAGSSDYERIVEWIVPDTRDANGRHVSESTVRNDPEKFQEAAWDAVRFRNPLDFPMTTAPAMVMSGGNFMGQSTSYFANKGELATLHVTKALSLRTRCFEQEEQAADRDREIVWIGGRSFRKVAVKGELTAANHRAEELTLVIRRRFSGELDSADGDPRCVLREDGVYSVNKRQELTWTVKLKPGKETTLTYHYTVLVYH